MPRGETLQSFSDRAREGRADGGRHRDEALGHVVELCAQGRRDEVFPWLIRSQASDPYVRGLTLVRLDMCMFMVSRYKSLRTLRKVREQLHDGVPKRDGWLTLEWLFDGADHGRRLALWVMELSFREGIGRVVPPEKFPYEPVFE
jgi:hypothetical protein